MLNVHLLTNLAICHRHRPKKKKKHIWGLPKDFYLFKALRYSSSLHASLFAQFIKLQVYLCWPKFITIRA